MKITKKNQLTAENSQCLEVNLRNQLNNCIVNLLFKIFWLNSKKFKNN